MLCPHCGANNPDPARFCNTCGQVLGTKTISPQLQRQGISLWGRPIPIAVAFVGVVAALCLVVSCLVIIALDQQGITFYSTFISRQTATPNVPLTQTGTPSYAELCDAKATANLTQAQGKDYINKLKGRSVSGWKRYIWDVNSFTLLGASQYRVTLTDQPNLQSWNIEAHTSDQQVLSLSKGQLWEFGGTITDGSVVSPGICMFYIDVK